MAAGSTGMAMAVEHVAEPVDLAALVEDPTRVATVPPGRIPALLSQLSALQGAMAARLISADRDEPMSVEDTLLTVDQAAERLGVSTDWLFRRSRTLPFVIRLGRHLRFSNRGIDRYLRTRTGR
jgi:excisionase family DNA binding protein